MLQRTRGAVIGAALVLALAGCSGGGADGGDGGKGGSGGGGVADAPFNPSQVAQAIPSKLAAPKGWNAQEPRVLDGSAAQQQCQTQGQWNCAGLTAQATTRQADYETNGDKDVDVLFTLLAYDSVDNAKAGLKAAVAETHKDANAKTTPLTLDAGADETDAFTEEGYATVSLRVGSVVAVMFGENLPKDHDIQSFAKLQVDRITTSATGKNPDA
ncbi:hypothetical protein [Streptomyces fradiae]|uniref:hypothetical protein n=1 Tax=Streptomyces fradiae TaxID=1906 RepID=UPI0035165C2B